MKPHRWVMEKIPHVVYGRNGALVRDGHVDPKNFELGQLEEGFHVRWECRECGSVTETDWMGNDIPELPPKECLRLHNQWGDYIGERFNPDCDEQKVKLTQYILEV